MVGSLQVQDRLCTNKNNHLCKHGRCPPPQAYQDRAPLDAHDRHLTSELLREATRSKQGAKQGANNNGGWRPLNQLVCPTSTMVRC